MTDEDRGSARRAYYVGTAGRPPRRTLLTALDRFDAEGRRGCAVDLGCGDGRDAIELLRRGWSVLALDAEPEAITRLNARTDLPGAGTRLVSWCGRFEESRWPACDLVNASFALPLCARDNFTGLWRKIGASLATDGRFAGQLYGPRDSWAGDPGLTIFEIATARALLAGYDIELFDEEESDAVTPHGRAKHWHIFHIVARRR